MHAHTSVPASKRSASNWTARARTLLVALFALIAAIPPAALASTPASPDPRIVEMTGIVVPVAREGRIANYLFLTIEVRVADGVDPWSVRERAHFMRDAVVRAVHRTSIASAGNVRDIDRARAEQVLLQAAVAAVPRSIASVRVTRVESLRR